MAEQLNQQPQPNLDWQGDGRCRTAFLGSEAFTLTKHRSDWQLSRKADGGFYCGLVETGNSDWQEALVVAEGAIARGEVRRFIAYKKADAEAQA